MNPIIMPAAMILDIIFGDPERLYHPVRLIGALITRSEQVLRKFCPNTAIGLTLGGLILVLVVLTVSFFIPFFILMFAYKISVYLGIAIEIIFCYQILAVKSMKDEVMRVFNALNANNILNARKFLGRIVGRDTKNLDETQIIKAGIETVAENTCDGVIAPLFFITVGGAPLGFLYKAVSTMDSMIGYKNDKYKNFGLIAAKFDDMLNFIPARITGFLYVIAAFILGYDYKNAFKILRRDRLNHASPNSAHGEAAAAGALNISLGGGAFYFGKFVPKPIIGDSLQEPTKTHIIKVLRMFYVVSFLGFLIFWLGRLGLMIFFQDRL